MGERDSWFWLWESQGPLSSLVPHVVLCASQTFNGAKLFCIKRCSRLHQTKYPASGELKLKGFQASGWCIFCLFNVLFREAFATFKQGSMPFVSGRPDFFPGRALLFMPGLDVVGSSSHSICLPWNYCNFEVFDCHGNVVYRGEMMRFCTAGLAGIHGFDPTMQKTWEHNAHSCNKRLVT